MKNKKRSLNSLINIVNNNPVKSSIRKSPKKRVFSKPRRHDEQDLSNRIGKDLDMLELQNKVLWHDRLNSGMAQRHGYWIKLCKEGTSDRYILLPDKIVLFIEVKANTKQRPSQSCFQFKVEQAGHKYYIVDSWENWVEVRNMHIDENIF